MTDRYWLPRRYTSRERPRYDDDTSSGVAWQPDVYRAAAAVARTVGAHQVVDVGCGRGEKLVALHPGLGLIGIDFGPNIDHCRSAYPFGTWIEHDLEEPGPLPLLDDQLRGSVIVSADVIEHLVAPERLLEKLAMALGLAKVVLLSTPERELWSGVRDGGPPRNACHVREWSIRELGQLLRTAGLPNHSIGLTRSNDRTEELHTSLAVITADSETLDKVVPTLVNMEPPPRRHSAARIRIARLLRVAIRG
ncbi:MAG: class I SAM-dependent methyltransferase [Candidatus Limnocylindria bacterium]